MPKVKRSRKAPPDGWELIEPTLDELDQKMREGESGSSCLGGLHPRDRLRRLYGPGINAKRGHYCGLQTLDMFCLLTKS